MAARFMAGHFMDFIDDLCIDATTRVGRSPHQTPQLKRSTLRNCTALEPTCVVTNVCVPAEKEPNKQANIICTNMPSVLFYNKLAPKAAKYIPTHSTLPHHKEHEKCVSAQSQLTGLPQNSNVFHMKSWYRGL